MMRTMRTIIMNDDGDDGSDEKLEDEVEEEVTIEIEMVELVELELRSGLELHCPKEPWQPSPQYARVDPQ